MWGIFADQRKIDKRRLLYSCNYGELCTFLIFDISCPVRGKYHEVLKNKQFAQLKVQNVFIVIAKFTKLLQVCSGLNLFILHRLANYCHRLVHHDIPERWIALSNYSPNVDMGGLENPVLETCQCLLHRLKLAKTEWGILTDNWLELNDKSYTLKKMQIQNWTVLYYAIQSWLLTAFFYMPKRVIKFKSTHVIKSSVSDCHHFSPNFVVGIKRTITDGNFNFWTDPNRNFIFHVRWHSIFFRE